MVTVDVLRSVVLALLAVSVLTDTVSIWLVLVAMFLLGTAELFADNTMGTFLPMLVHRDDLGAGQLPAAGRVHHDQPAGRTADRCRPVRGRHGLAVRRPGGAGPAAVVLLTRIVAAAARPGPADAPTRIRHDIVEGIRWARDHAAVRTLILTILMFNVTFGAAWSVLVLYATERLGLGEVGFGLITTVSAVGGLLGTARTAGSPGT